MSKEISFLKVPEVTETMAPEIKFPPDQQIKVKLGNNDYYAVITVRDNKKWRKYILDQLLQSWKDNLEEARCMNERTQGGGRGGGRGGSTEEPTEEPTEESTEKSIMQQYLTPDEKESWDSQKENWNKLNVFFENFEDLINEVEKDLLKDFKYIDMCWEYYLLMYQACEITSLRSEMDMCKNNCNVHVKIHFEKSGEEMQDVLKLRSIDGPDCLTFLQHFLPQITGKLQQIYPEENIFTFVPLAVISRYHQSKNEIESNGNVILQKCFIDQADKIWLELTKQKYEFFMDFIHSCTYESIPDLENTCPVFVTRKNPFLVHLKTPP